MQVQVIPYVGAFLHVQVPHHRLIGGVLREFVDGLHVCAVSLLLPETVGGKGHAAAVGGDLHASHERAWDDGGGECWDRVRNGDAVGTGGEVSANAGGGGLIVGLTESGRAIDRLETRRVVIVVCVRIVEAKGSRETRLPAIVVRALCVRHPC